MIFGVFLSDVIQSLGERPTLEQKRKRERPQGQRHLWTHAGGVPRRVVPNSFKWRFSGARDAPKLIFLLAKFYRQMLLILPKAQSPAFLTGFVSCAGRAYHRGHPAETLRNTVSVYKCILNTGIKLEVSV